jgi:hypothetical protein
MSTSTPVKAPWDSHRKDRDHPYSDFEAFERWMSSRPNAEPFFGVWEGMDLPERIDLYSLFGKAIGCNAELVCELTNAERLLKLPQYFFSKDAGWVGDDPAEYAEVRLKGVGSVFALYGARETGRCFFRVTNDGDGGSNDTEEITEADYVSALTKTA